MVHNNSEKNAISNQDPSEPQSQNPAKEQHAKTGYQLSAEEQIQRKRRNLAIGLSIIGFVILVYLVTIVRLGASVAERSF